MSTKPGPLQVILDEIGSTIEIKEGARTRKVTKLAALTKRLMAEALSGGHRALSMLLPLILAAVGDKALTQATEGLSEIEKEMLWRNSASLLAKLAAKAKKRRTPKRRFSPNHKRWRLQRYNGDRI